MKKPRGKNRLTRLVEKKRVAEGHEGVGELVSVLSIMYQVASVQAYYNSELHDILKRHDLSIDKVPKLLSDLEKSLDGLFDYMSPILVNEEELIKDFEVLLKSIEKWRKS